MTKKQILDRVANKLKNRTTKRAVREIIDTYLEEISKALSKNEKVLISGHGTYYPKWVEDKDVIIPRTTTRKTVKAHWVVRFTPGNDLKNAVR